MSRVQSAQKYGNQILLKDSLGNNSLAYPTVGALWIVSGGGGIVPPPPEYPNFQTSIVGTMTGVIGQVLWSRFVAGNLVVGTTNNIYYSSDNGVTWNASTNAHPFSWGVPYVANNEIYITYQSPPRRSIDGGVTFTDIDISALSLNFIRGFAYNGSYYLMVYRIASSLETRIAISMDGETFTDFSLLFAGSGGSQGDFMLFEDEFYFIAGGGHYKSSDGSSWSIETNPYINYTSYPVPGFIAGSALDSSGYVLRVYDGFNWFRSSVAEDAAIIIDRDPFIQFAYDRYWMIEERATSMFAGESKLVSSKSAATFVPWPIYDTTNFIRSICVGADGALFIFEDSRISTSTKVLSKVTPL